MGFNLNIPTYTSKDIPIMFGSMIPMTVLINYFLWDNEYWNHAGILFPATIVTLFSLCLAYIFFGMVAISLRQRFPHEKQSFKRLCLSILLFILMSGVYLSLLLRAYDYFHFLGYNFREVDFPKAFAILVVMNIFLTFLNEGVSRFENYRVTIRQTEQLKKEYMQSQLLGLKSQLNPHFLFNSLNTLSSLIHEDAEIAEEFLDHMSKVYRYLLRNNDEQLVSLSTEISFIQSYFFILKSRHSEGIFLKIDAELEMDDYLIPPLTLQMIMESAVNQNSLSKANPLVINIHAVKKCLVITNTIQPKINKEEGPDLALENISKKMKLLCDRDISIEIKIDCCQRIIKIPLIAQKDLVPA
jgi:two-component system, LytTR family, sensor kinase